VKGGNSEVEPFRDLVESIVSGDAATAVRLLDASPRLVRAVEAAGATRQSAKETFFEQISHYVYGGDTALHMAAAAHQPRIADELIARGADVRARNRRGAEPLHYAVDGGPGSARWDPTAQTEIVASLIRAGADPNAVDKSGVAPLHRAVRNRCAAAVKALIDGGADPRAPNGNGSAPLLLALQNTGKSGSGSVGAKAQQEEILQILMRHGGPEASRHGQHRLKRG
jgi:Ankyrin repeats (many copies)